MLEDKSVCEGRIPKKFLSMKMRGTCQLKDQTLDSWGSVLQKGIKSWSETEEELGDEEEEEEFREDREIWRDLIARQPQRGDVQARGWCAEVSYHSAQDAICL